ncbi:nuclear transport factor 2 family protein [Chitinophagaceae bacterium LWZ2-11]
MKATFVLITFVFLSVSGHAQTTTVDSVKATVNNLFTAMRNVDATLLFQCFAENAILQTVATRDGQVVVSTQRLSDFANNVNLLPKNAADERITFEVVKVDGDLAIAWTPYEFFYNGKFSHYGVNSFQLVRVAGGWKIQYIIDTRKTKKE